MNPFVPLLPPLSLFLRNIPVDNPRYVTPLCSFPSSCSLLLPANARLQLILIYQPKALMITLDNTFGDVIGLVARTRVHRVWVVDADHRPIGVVSFFFIYFCFLILLFFCSFALLSFVLLLLSFFYFILLFF